VGELRYHPYGGTRYSWGTTPTSRRFTGQREDATIGLYFYDARYYDPALGRFISADTIVPSPGDPQDLNRYSYVRNNALRYVDPSGHIAETEIDDANAILEELELYNVGVKVDWGWVLDIGGDDTIWYPGLWKLSELHTLLQTVKDFADIAGSVEATQRAIGGATFKRVSSGVTGHWGWGRITLADYTFNQSGMRRTLGSRIAIAHELAHYWDWKTGGISGKIFNQSGQIVQNLPQEVGPTAYGRTHPNETWAESVAGYVYPSYFGILRAEGDPNENYQQNLQYGPITMNFKMPGLTPLHYAYVKQQFQALQVTR